MRRQILAAFALSAVLCVSAQDYNAVTFETKTGDVTTVNAENLSMAVNSGNLVVSHSDGELSTPLSDLSKFYFSAVTTGISSVLDSVEGSFDVYSVSGVYHGQFSSPEALNSLPAGNYVVKAGSQTIKINVVR